MRLEGTDLIGRKPTALANMGIARTFQNLGLFANLDVIDNLMLGRHVRMRTGFLAGMVWLGPARREELVNRRRVEAIVELLELDEHRHTHVGLLPYGVQKSIALGRAPPLEPQPPTGTPS